MTFLTLIFKLKIANLSFDAPRGISQTHSFFKTWNLTDHGGIQTALYNNVS